MENIFRMENFFCESGFAGLVLQVFRFSKFKNGVRFFSLKISLFKDSLSGVMMLPV